MSDWKELLREAKELFDGGLIKEAEYNQLRAEALALRKQSTASSSDSQNVADTFAGGQMRKSQHPNSACIHGIIDDQSRGVMAEGCSLKKSSAQYLKPISFGAGKAQHELVLLPAGSFMMGDDHHKVELTKDFYVGKYPVTQKLWGAVMGANPSAFKGEGRPEERVSWLDCVAFCNQLSALEGKDPVYQGLGGYKIGQQFEDEGWLGNSEKAEALSANIRCNWNANGYRLLSEAEWEYAARAPAAATQGARAKYPPYAARANQQTLYSGSNEPDEVAWYDGNSEKETHPVGQKKPNGFGLYDMSGNVWEWCWDWFGNYSIENQRDPTGASTGSDRVVRGGSWGNSEGLLRVSYRSGLGPTLRYERLGFRIGRSVP